MVERGTGPRSPMEGSKGGQEPGGDLAVYVSRTELSMSSSIKSQSLRFPSHPFIDEGGSKGYRWVKRGKYQGYRRSFEGLGSSFSSKLASDMASWCQRLARSPGTCVLMMLCSASGHVPSCLYGRRVG